ncbi:Crp/Fnr family transcriptional regulator [Marinifilum flexuosum]|uniref:Crp/Fnr family transcriptional regulator n=1 Tax=Marinifilum flexuosum TaxID=1117708 RepID=UPI002494879B|nr:Crp/Fnr family transcriptional regulator [Marinifilum flexuosum]
MDSTNLREALRDYIKKFIHLSEEEFELLCDLFSYRKLKKREHLIKAQERCDRIIFTANGYFRFYHWNDKGIEITSDFYFAPSFITSYTSFLIGEPSLVNVQAMESMEVLEISKSDLEKLYVKSRNIETLARKLAEMIAINSERHLFLLLGQTAETRYKELMEKHPQYIQSIPLQYIASYLGITKESLSRIRKSIH